MLRNSELLEAGFSSSLVWYAAEPDFCLQTVGFDAQVSVGTRKTALKTVARCRSPHSDAAGEAEIAPDRKLVSGMAVGCKGCAVGRAA